MAIERSKARAIVYNGTGRSLSSEYCVFSAGCQVLRMLLNPCATACERMLAHLLSGHCMQALTLRSNAERRLVTLLALSGGHKWAPVRRVATHARFDAYTCPRRY
jgi:hypothetical protein